MAARLNQGEIAINGYNSVRLKGLIGKIRHSSNVVIVLGVTYFTFHWLTFPVMIRIQSSYDLEGQKGQDNYLDLHFAFDLSSG